MSDETKIFKVAVRRDRELSPHLRGQKRTYDWLRDYARTVPADLLDEVVDVREQVGEDWMLFERLVVKDML